MSLILLHKTSLVRDKLYFEIFEDAIEVAFFNAQYCQENPTGLSP